MLISERWELACNAGGYVCFRREHAQLVKDRLNQRTKERPLKLCACNQSHFESFLGLLCPWGRNLWSAVRHSSDIGGRTSKSYIRARSERQGNGWLGQQYTALPSEQICLTVSKGTPAGGKSNLGNVYIPC
eukprot:6341462-Amphidinium_carterae.1